MKEIIIADIRSQPHKHAGKWETIFEHEGFESYIYLKDNWPSGKVKITIERESEPTSGGTQT